MSAVFDVVVVGAGPAGMAAAAAAASAGASVLLLDDNPHGGGQIGRRRSVAGPAHAPRIAALEQLERRIASLGVTCRFSARVVAAPAPNTLRLELHDGFFDVRYQRLILATGARERFLPFPGWTLPGVLGVGGLEAMVKAGLPIAGKRVVLAGSGPLLLAVGAHLAAQGARIAGIFEQASLPTLARFALTLLRHPGKLMEGARYRGSLRGTPYRAGCWVSSAAGDGRLEAVTVAMGARTQTIECDYLGCGFHLVPNLELAQLLGCRIECGYMAVSAHLESSVPGVYGAGEVTGIGGLDKALLEGHLAGLAAAGRDPGALRARRRAQLRFARSLDAAFAPRSELRALATPETILCRCEDVARGAVEGARHAREAKLHTRCGMGACQGRICGPAAAFLFDWERQSVRPPVLPARLATLAAPVDPASPAP